MHMAASPQYGTVTLHDVQRAPRQSGKGPVDPATARDGTAPVPVRPPHLDPETPMTVHPRTETTVELRVDLIHRQAALSKFNCRILVVGVSFREMRRSVQVGFETPCTGRAASFPKWSDSAPIPSDGWYSPMFPPSRPRFSKSFRLRAEACGFRSRVFASVVLKAVFRVREKRNLPRLLGCVVFPHVKSRLHFYSALGFAE